MSGYVDLSYALPFILNLGKVVQFSRHYEGVDRTISVVRNKERSQIGSLARRLMSSAKIASLCEHYEEVNSTICNNFVAKGGR